jgi:ComF family protein
VAWQLLRRLVDAIAPNPCLGCGSEIGVRADRLGLCLACWGRLRRVARRCRACGGALVAQQEEPLCPACQRDARHGEPLLFLFDYETPLDGVIRALKFGRRDELAQPLGRLLAERVAAEPSLAPEVVCEVPLHWRRRVQRGYDQAALLAAATARALCLPRRSLLRRYRATQAQTRLARGERLNNLRSAFALQPWRSVAGSCVLLVDDVVTTGATLEAAARVLRAAGARQVIRLAVARTPEG